MNYLLLINLIPIRTDRTLRAVPYVTYALCFFNILIYLTTLPHSPYQLGLLVQKWGFTAGSPSIASLLSSAFLHTDLLHLLGNMFILWLVGTVLEAGIGSLLFSLLYLASLITATVLYGLIGRIFLPDSLGIPLIGASGAISGITGYAAFRYFRLRVFTLLLVLIVPIPLWIPMWGYAGFFALREILAGITEVQSGHGEMVAHWAHIGGLALGALAAVLLRVIHEGKRENVLEDIAKATGQQASGISLHGRSRENLQRMLRERPDDPELLEAVAALWVVKGDLQQSSDIYLRAIPLFLATGRTDRAATSYLNVLRAFPNTVLNPQAQMTVASALERLGHHKEAARAFMLAAIKYADQDDAPTALMRAAQIHTRYLNDRSTACTLLRTLQTDYPNSPWRRLADDRLREMERM